MCEYALIHTSRRRQWNDAYTESISFGILKERKTPHPSSLHVKEENEKIWFNQLQVLGSWNSFSKYV